MSNDTEKTNFTDVSGAISQLTSEGWHITFSTFYRHKKHGKIRRSADGTYTLSSLRKYAKNFLRRRDAATLLKEAVEKELVRRAPEIVTLVAGDPEKIENLTEYFKRSIPSG